MICNYEYNLAYLTEYYCGKSFEMMQNSSSILALATLVAALFFHSISAASPGIPQRGPRVEIKPDVPLVLFEALSANKVLTCSALGDKPDMFDTLRWSGPNRNDNWDELNRKHKTKETHRKGYALELEFQRPTPDDSGTYYCQGTYQKSDVYNASITVRVYNPMKIENCPDRQFILEGSSSEKITCRITGDSLSLVFYKDDTHLDGSNSNYKWDNEDSLELRNPVTISDAGIYRFEVTSELTGNREKKEVQVEVHSKPQFPPDSVNSFTSIEGEPSTLRCNVTGNPRPLVYWLDPKLRNSSSVGGYFVNPEEGTLLISKVNRVDNHGEFTCIARNTVGEESKKVKMTVMERPRIFAFENKTFEEGTEAFFECRATGFPKPTFSIRKAGLNQTPYHLGDAYVTDVAEDTEGGQAPGFVYRLKVKVDRSQFGLHYCSASNEAGIDERAGTLLVKHRPDLSATPREQFFKLGDRNVALAAHIKAYPPPTVTLYRENEQQFLDIKTDFKTGVDGQTHVVTMSPTTQRIDGQGTFRCVANNGIGAPSEILIRLRYMTRPGQVTAVVSDRTPTTVKLQLGVIDDGGSRIRAYKYSLEGRTLDIYHPPYISRPVDIHNETALEALPGTATYTIKNLKPDYRYSFSIRAVNEMGDGDLGLLTLETRKATVPDPPIILKPAVVSPAQVGYTSEYQNGYLLKWSPPDLDNGEPVIRYKVKLYKIKPDLPDLHLSVEEALVVDQTTDRPLHARIGPLDTNSYYKIHLHAINKIGESEPATLIINTLPSRPFMPEFNSEPLTWLSEPSTPVLVGIIVLALLFLIVIDIAFCVCYQIGVSYFIRSCCCPPKANSVISDKTYT